MISLIGQKRLPLIYTDPLLMDFQLHAHSDKSIVLFLSAFQALSAVGLVYQINKIALVTASI